MNIQSNSLEMTSVHLRRMIISAMFLSMALVTRVLFGMDLPLFGASGIRISIHVIFSAMPAILFGPVYGAIVAGLTDFLGFHIRPTGPYWLPQLTLIAALGGFIRGALWMFLRNKSALVMRKLVATVSVILLIAGIYGMAALSADGINRDFYLPYTEGSYVSYVNGDEVTVWLINREAIDTSRMSLLGRLAVSNSVNTINPTARIRDFIVITATMIGAAAFGLLLVGVDWAVNKFFLGGQTETFTMSLLIAMVAAAVVVNLLNTAVFLQVLAVWQHLPFWVVGLPRLTQAMVQTILITYVVVMLLGVCSSHPHLRKWMNIK